MPWHSQIRMMRWVRAAVRSCARPGRAGEIHSSRPTGSVTTCTFTPWRRCLWEKSARLSPTRSHSARVPSSRTYSGVGLAQGAQQAGCAVGEQADDGCHVGGGGADGDAEAGRELGEGVVSAQVHQADQRTLVRRELAAAVALSGDDEHGDPLDQGVRQVECGRIRNQRGSCACGETSNTSPNGTGASCVAPTDSITRSAAT